MTALPLLKGGYESLCSSRYYLRNWDKDTVGEQELLLAISDNPFTLAEGVSDSDSVRNLIACTALSDDGAIRRRPRYALVIHHCTAEPMSVELVDCSQPTGNLLKATGWAVCGKAASV